MKMTNMTLPHAILHENYYRGLQFWSARLFLAVIIADDLRLVVTLILVSTFDWFVTTSLNSAVPTSGTMYICHTGVSHVHNGIVCTRVPVHTSYPYRDLDIRARTGISRC